MKNGLEVNKDGSKAWYVDDKHHREDGPAVEDANGYKAWYVDGKRHRTDGPAIEYTDGSKEWYVDDIQYTEEEFYIKTGQLEKLL